MSFWAEGAMGIFILIVIVFVAFLSLKIIGETILCCIKVYEKISEKLSSSSIRTTTVVPTTVTPISNIKYIEPLNCIIIENPNTNECNKYAIGVPIKN
tara:strand:- start:125 stop:418 length:294 start_codon:yes stop_codon:yes gene_type:complete